MSDLHVKRGDSIVLAVGPVLKADGSVQDITGHSLRFTAKNRITDTDGVAPITGTTAGGQIVITDGPGGLARVTIPAAQTDGFTTDRVLLWDLQISDPSGVVKTLDSGKLIVTRDVTRTT